MNENPKTRHSFGYSPHIAKIFRETQQHDLGLAIKIKSSSIVPFIMLNHSHTIATKRKDRTQEFLPLKRTIESDVGLTRGAWLDVHNTHLVNITEERAKRSGEGPEIVLVHGGLQLHDRRVFIDQCVAARHKDFLPKRRTGRGILQRKARRDMGARVGSEVGHRS